MTMELSPEEDTFDALEGRKVLKNRTIGKDEYSELDSRLKKMLFG